MYRAIIFDFFDVIRTDPYQAWLRRHGIKREGDYAEVSKPLDRGELTLDGFYKKLEEISGHSAKTVEHEYNNTDPVDEGIAELISDLKNNYKIGLLSNSRADYLRDLLNEHSLTDLFDVIVISSEINHIKPSVEAFKHTLEQLDVPANQSIFIDDNLHNVEAAQSLGIEAIQFKDLESLQKQLVTLGIKLR